MAEAPTATPPPTPPPILNWGKDLTDYLFAGKTNFRPALYGALGGAGLGAMATEEREQETPKARALRTLRNALIGGSLGGVGMQALSAGGPAIAKEFFDKKKNPDDPGFGKSPVARILAGLTGGLLPRIRRSKRMQESFTQVVGPNGLGNMRAGAGPMTKFPSTAGLTGDARTSKIYEALKQMRGLKEVGVNAQGTGGVNALDALTEHLENKNPNWYRGMISTKGLTATQIAERQASRAKDWLRSAGVGGTDNFARRGVNWIDRTLINANPLAATRMGRNLGRAKTLGFAGAGMLAPDVIAWGLNRLSPGPMGEGALTRAFGPIMPMPAEPPPDTLLDTLLTGRNLPSWPSTK